MERLPGSPLDLSPLTSTQNRELGQSLRRLFEVPLEAMQEIALPHRRLGPRDLPTYLREAYGHLPTLSGSKDTGLVRTALDRALSHLSEVRTASESPVDVMGIADLNPSNVLWDGSVCRFLDFEDGGRTTLEFDLADHVEHIGARLHGVYDAQRLAAAVGLTAEQSPRFEEHRRLWALYWLHALLPGHSAHARNPRGTTEKQSRHVLELLQ